MDVCTWAAASFTLQLHQIRPGMRALIKATTHTPAPRRARCIMSGCARAADRSRAATRRPLYGLLVLGPFSALSPPSVESPLCYIQCMQSAPLRGGQAAPTPGRRETPQTSDSGRARCRSPGPVTETYEGTWAGTLASATGCWGGPWCSVVHTSKAVYRQPSA